MKKKPSDLFFSFVFFFFCSPTAQLLPGCISEEIYTPFNGMNAFLSMVSAAMLLFNIAYRVVVLVSLSLTLSLNFLFFLSFRPESALSILRNGQCSA